MVCWGGSPHRTEVEVLRRRAGEFLEEAHEALKRGHYDLSCFFSEQAVQLHLKSVLLERVGDYPRTHRVRLLLSEVSKEVSLDGLEGFFRDYRARLCGFRCWWLKRATPVPKEWGMV